MNLILTAAKQLLHKEEVIISTLKCSLTDYMNTHKVPYPGMLLATNRRLLFYGQCKNTFIAEFEYKKIVSIETKRRIFDKKIIFYYEDEYITLGYITSSNIEGFIDLLQKNAQLA
ncbi:PlcR-regulated protein PRP2 [Bacillus mycoides]|uniref:PlcR-regulated protein PRP2 n=1 Tax=Bacillus proteolyticus TaxID=2026192 RepID=A0AA44KYK8_9BACI|nr:MULTISPECIES: PH domain-containing protein [Bacillus]MED1507779.1 PH domain-containing protein [Bacillus proteolyticus]OJD71541.1 PlcR-regulated protein PRP2 [Bacillus sp. NH11B]OJE49589.1 PlcR-regulated protein PRP2 [Bacillus proteolyticus]GLV66663.1 PlcR-regulated protein PRP2 [Bacillus mycoides]